MKILIIGAGVIGSIYGWVLSQNDNEIIHLVRSNKKDNFRNGIPIDILDIIRLFLIRFHNYGSSIKYPREFLTVLFCPGH
jgi:ketopantoate reductase